MELVPWDAAAVDCSNVTPSSLFMISSTIDAPSKEPLVCVITDVVGMTLIKFVFRKIAVRAP